MWVVIKHGCVSTSCNSSRVHLISRVFSRVEAPAQCGNRWMQTIITAIPTQSTVRASSRKTTLNFFVLNVLLRTFNWYFFIYFLKHSHIKLEIISVMSKWPHIIIVSHVCSPLLFLYSQFRAQTINLLSLAESMDDKAVGTSSLQCLSSIVDRLSSVQSSGAAALRDMTTFSPGTSDSQPCTPESPGTRPVYHVL